MEPSLARGTSHLKVPTGSVSETADRNLRDRSSIDRKRASRIAWGRVQPSSPSSAAPESTSRRPDISGWTIISAAPSVHVSDARGNDSGYTSTSMHRPAFIVSLFHVCQQTCEHCQHLSACISTPLMRAKTI
eukprot:3715026-Rhodomonas_salina.5